MIIKPLSIERGFFYSFLFLEKIIIERIIVSAISISKGDMTTIQLQRMYLRNFSTIKTNVKTSQKLNPFPPIFSSIPIPPFKSLNYARRHDSPRYNRLWCCRCNKLVRFSTTYQLTGKRDAPYYSQRLHRGQSFFPM